VFRYLKY